MTSFLSQNKIFLLILFSLAFEFSNKIAPGSSYGIIGPSLIFKSIFVAIAVILAFRERNKSLIYPLTILLSYFCIELIIRPSIADDIFFTYGLRYLYFIFFLAVLVNNNHLKEQKFLRFFDWLICFNSVLILIGLLFDVNVFNTYTGIRFGFNGFLNMPSDTNYIYIFYALLNVYKYRRRTLEYKFLIHFNLIISLLTGTKAVIASSIVALVIIYFIKPNKALSGLYLSLALILAAFSEKIYLALGPTRKIFVKIYEEQGVLSALSSYRYHNLKNRFRLYLEDSSWFNYLMYNERFIEIRVEMEMFDMLFFWGAIGIIIYLIIYFKIHIQIINEKRDLYIIFILLIIACLAGKFLTNFVAMLLVYTYLTLKKDSI